MKKYLFVLMIVLVLSSVGEARFVVAPTADVIADGQISLGYFFHRGRNNLTARLGVADSLEVGIRGVLADEGRLVTNVQFAVAKETISSPGVGLGLQLDGGRVGFYGVLSKQLGAPGFRGHVAWGTGNYSQGKAGITAVLNPVQVSSASGIRMPTLSAALEYDGTGLNTGLTARFSPDFQGHVYLTDFKSLGLGLSYRLAF